MTATSRHLGGSAELTVIMPIKSGFVDVSATRTYATRLRILLRTLDAIRKRGIEREPFRTLSGPVERIRTIKEIRWLIFDNDTKFLLAVAFDRPWQPYIRKIARDAGPVLDAILCNCAGYTENGYTSEHGYHRFADWVRKYQQEPDFYYTAEPFQTVDDAAYLESLEDGQRAAGNTSKFDHEAAQLVVPDPSAVAKKAAAQDRTTAVQQGLQTLHTMYRLRELHPEPAPGSSARDHIYLLKLARAILADFELDDLVPKRHRKALAWLRNVPPDYRLTRNRPPTACYDPENVQADILTPLDGMTHGALLLLQVSCPERFLDVLTSAEFQAHISRESACGRVTGVAMTLALTYAGLERLGLPQEILEQFPKEFRDGMAARGPLLGDVRANHPDYWSLPRWQPSPAKSWVTSVRLSSIDVVIKIQTHVNSGSHEMPESLRQVRDEIADTPGLTLLAVEPLWRNQAVVDGETVVREHFGFVDGLSQPEVTATLQESEADVSYPGEKVPRGEILLGHENVNADPFEVPELLQNGTFEVIRKLEQNVAAYREILNSAPTTTSQHTWEQKLMGRAVDGAPATDSSLGNLTNDFTYKKDRGQGCPFAAHIRRANPRTVVDDAPVPRIVRRGFSYGPTFDVDPDASRGLMFMAYNASIAEQFEVIQRWISGGNASGVNSSQRDPFLGVNEDARSNTFRFSDGKAVHRIDLAQDPMDPLVKLNWGVYLFVPSISNLARLKELCGQSATDPAKTVDAGLKTIQNLRLLEQLQGADAAKQAWKQLLEDLSSMQAGKAAEVWSAIRHHHDGILDTPYGVLVAGADQVLEVFSNHETYSVRTYWERMRASIGDIYLGMDPNPQKMAPEVRTAADVRYEAAVAPGDYDVQTDPVNKIIYQQSENEIFALALKISQDVLKDWFGQRPKPTAVDLRRFYADQVLARLSGHWFGLPNDHHMFIGGVPGDNKDPDPVHCPHHFLAPSRYIFPPNPTAHGANLAQQDGQALLKAAQQYVLDLQDGSPDAKPGSLLEDMLPGILDPKATEPGEHYYAKTLVGVMHGFFPTTFGNFLNVLHTWMKDERLWRLQQQLLTDSARSKHARAKAVLEAPLIEMMMRKPIPDTLHRRTTTQTTLTGHQIPAGAKVVVGVGSACHEQLEQNLISPHIVFGGDYGKKAAGAAPVHACPGQPMALGTLLAMFSALLEYGAWKPSGTPLVLEVTDRD